MFDIKCNHIHLTQGDTPRATLIIHDKTTHEIYEPSDNEIIKFCLKRNKRQEEANLEIQMSDSKLIINSDDSKKLYVGDYTYYIKIFLNNGDINTIASGLFTVMDGCVCDISEYSESSIISQSISNFNCEFQIDNTLRGVLNYDVVDSGGDAILQFDTYGLFPNNGKSNILYIDKSENTSYRWDQEHLKYYIVGNNYNNIKTIQGGDSSYGKSNFN